jgi:transposase InsO family protein
MKEHKLLQRRRQGWPEGYQAAKLFELLPKAPDELWSRGTSGDVTYGHIPGLGGGYAVTVIDSYSRYLLAGHLTFSYSASEVTAGLQLAKEEAERIHGPRAKPPVLVTDKGPSFLAKRFREFVHDLFEHVRIRYRTPTPLGLRERFPRTLKEEEIDWRL